MVIVKNDCPRSPYGFSLEEPPVNWLQQSSHWSKICHTHRNKNSFKYSLSFFFFFFPYTSRNLNEGKSNVTRHTWYHSDRGRLLYDKLRVFLMATQPAVRIAWQNNLQRELRGWNIPTETVVKIAPKKAHSSHDTCGIQSSEWCSDT